MIRPRKRNERKSFDNEVLGTQLPVLKIWSTARNCGFKEAKGDYIAFLGADDTWHEDFIHGDQRSIANNLLQKGLDGWRLRCALIDRFPKCFAHLSQTKIRDLTPGRLLDWGFICYWQRERASGHPMFRRLMREGYGSHKEWLYMPSALLPLNGYERLVNFVDKARNTGDRSHHLPLLLARSSWKLRWQGQR